MNEQKKTIHDEDAPLVIAARKGDTRAFETIVKKYEKKMFNIAYRITGSYEEACEAAQDAFVAAYKSLGGFESNSKFSTWLAAITVNVSRNRLRQIKTRPEQRCVNIGPAFSGEDGRLSIDPPSVEPHALDTLEQKEINIKLQGCIQALDPEYREVLVLRDMQDFSYEDISETLGIVEGTVKSRLFRARDAVKNCMKKALGAVWQTVTT